MSRLPLRAVVALALGPIVALSTSCVSAPPVGPFADPTHTVERLDDLQYGEAIDENGQPEPLDLTMFRPADAAASPRPAIVFIHSGAFTGGYRSEQDDIAQEFARRGYVTVTITYRLREGAWIWFNTPSDVALGAARDARHDAQAAVRWLRANAATYGVDGGHIAAVGYSAGAITALGMAEHPEDPGDSGTPDQSSRICVAVSLSGIPVEGDIGPDSAPVLMFHGGSDPIVPTAYARQGAWTAGANHRLVDYVELKGIGHLLFYQSRDQYMPKMVETLRTYLVDGPSCQ